MSRQYLLPLNFENLQVLDGGVLNELFMYHLQRAASDCANRPADDRPRKVIFELHVTPVADADKQTCLHTNVEVIARSKVPDHRSRAYQMKATRDGLMFNRDFEDAVDQQALFGDDDDEGYLNA